MNLETFKDKLKKLNENLWVDTSRLDLSTQQVGTACGIYLNGVRDSLGEARGLGSELTSMVNKFNDRPFVFIGWVNYGRIFEGDSFLENGRVNSLGWRTVIKRLIDKNFTSKEKAREVFGYTESFYDKLDYHGKLNYFKKYGL